LTLASRLWPHSHMQLHFESSDAPVTLARRLVRFPLRLVKPKGFRTDRPASWPRLEGQLECVEGELFFTRRVLIFNKTSPAKWCEYSATGAWRMKVSLSPPTRLGCCSGAMRELPMSRSGAAAT
jgi:hypothetical protein